MTKSQNVIGLAVISINDGRELGKVRDLIINPYKGEVEYLVIENDSWYLGAQVIPFKFLMGAGEYAVTIESPDAITSLREQPDAAALLNLQVRIKGTKVLTRKGRFIGAVEEFYVDVETGKIICCELVTASEGATKFIPVKGIVTFGRDVLVVTDEVDQLLVESLDKIGADEENAFEVKAEVKAKPQGPAVPDVAFSLPAKELETAVVGSLPKAKGRKPAPTPLKEEEPPQAPPVIPPVAEEAQGEGESEEQQLFGELQNQYYIGKKVAKRIEDAGGKVLADEGETIDEALLKRVKDAGKYLELIMNVQE